LSSTERYVIPEPRRDVDGSRMDVVSMDESATNLYYTLHGTA